MQNDPPADPIIDNPDVVLIGGGIMSVTLGTMLKRLNPELTIQIIDALPRIKRSILTCEPKRIPC